MSAAGTRADYEALRRFPMIDFSSLHHAPQLASLAADPRFADLFPSDFSDPFVEGSGAPRLERRGHRPRVRVGGAVVSAPANQPGGGAAGKVYVYSGRSGALLWSASGSAGDRLGTGVEGAGDVDGNGAAAFLVTSAWSLINGVRSGRAMVVSGRKR